MVIKKQKKPSLPKPMGNFSLHISLKTPNDLKQLNPKKWGFQIKPTGMDAIATPN